MLLGPFRLSLSNPNHIHCLGFLAGIYIYIYVAGTFWYNATVLLSDPICFHTCLLVCSQLVSLFLYLHCDSSLWVLSVKGISPCFPFLTSLSIAQCSSFWWLWDRTQVPSVFVLVSLLHSHMWLFSLGASGAQYAPCPLSVYVLVPLVLSNSCPYFSLSLLLFFSLGAYLDTWFSPVPHLPFLVPSNVYP